MKHVIDGLIVFLSEEEWSGFEMLTKMSIPVIALNCPEGPAGIDTILVNDRESVAKVIAHHGEQGHKKIGFIAATQTDYVARERLAGAKEAVQNDPSIQLEVFTGDYSRKSGYYGAKALLEKGQLLFLSAITICRLVPSNVSIKKVSESGRILRSVTMII